MIKTKDLWFKEKGFEEYDESKIWYCEKQQSDEEQQKSCGA